MCSKIRRFPDLFNFKPFKPKKIKVEKCAKLIESDNSFRINVSSKNSWGTPYGILPTKKINKK